jgi:uncharacterized protein involved in tolerance to divalent cations
LVNTTKLNILSAARIAVSAWKRGGDASLGNANNLLLHHLVNCCNNIEKCNTILHWDNSREMSSAYN